MCAAVVQAREALLRYDTDCREDQDRCCGGEHVQHGHLNFTRLNFLAEVFGCASDHQAGDEYSEYDENEHTVQTRADAAKNHFAELHIDQ